MPAFTSAATGARFGPFQPFADRGLTQHLLPIIPPQAAIGGWLKLTGEAAEKERARVESLKANRGKIPGHCYEPPSPKYPGGVWGGMKDWTAHRATESELERWATCDSGVGLLAREYPAADIDVTDAVAAARIMEFTVANLGPAPIRRGNDPKLLMMYRAAAPMKKQRLAFTLGGSEHAVELLADGQQYVVAGIHPKTRRPYRWDGDQLPEPDQLALIGPEEVANYFRKLKRFIVDELGGEIIEGRLGRSAPQDATERRLIAPVAELAANEAALRDLVANLVADDPPIADRSGDADRDERVERLQAVLTNNWNAVQLISGACVHDSQLMFGADCARAGLDLDESVALTKMVLDRALALGNIDRARYDARFADCGRTVLDGYHRAYARMTGTSIQIPASAEFAPVDENGEALGDPPLVQIEDRPPTLEEVRAHLRRAPRLLEPPRDADQGALLVAAANDNGPAGRPTRFTASELMAMEFLPTKYVVPGYITEGLTILAGAPKIGKSWLSLDLAVQVASGGEVLGRRVESGDVLYAALEDNPRRLQQRLRTLQPFGDPPPNLDLWVELPRLEDGGLQQLARWIAKATAPTLIIIDTLAVVRKTKTRDESNYEADYKAIRPLQRLALDTGIAIIVVHHVRKQEANDPLEAVSGTNGLTGAADSVLVLARTQKGVHLTGRGRDIQEFDVAVELNPNSCRWTVLGGAEMVAISQARKELIAYLEMVGEPVGNGEIARGLRRSPAAVSNMCGRMMAEGQLQKLDSGKFALVPPLDAAPVEAAVRRLVG